GGGGGGGGGGGRGAAPGGGCRGGPGGGGAGGGPPRSAWPTSTGGRGRSPCAAGAAALSGCPCPPTLARRSPATCVLAGRSRSRAPGRCSCAPGHRTAG